MAGETQQSSSRSSNGVLFFVLGVISTVVVFALVSVAQALNPVADAGRGEGTTRIQPALNGEGA